METRWKFGCLSIALSAAALLFLLLPAPARAVQEYSIPLTFEDRVQFATAIEQVYWNHRIWPEQNKTPKPPLEAVLPKASIRGKVEDYLRKSNALGIYWQRPVTAQQLQAEMDRMARETRKPDVLRELFAALQNDPYLIAECMARPIVADRLIHNIYAGDESMFEEWWSNTRLQIRAEVAAPSSVYLLSDVQPDGAANADDTWSPTATTNAPAGRYIHTAVWTGSEMILWGGYDGTTPYLNTGGLYNPATNSWVAGGTSTTNAPGGRQSHTAVWTGTEMIVWGGYDFNHLNTGGRYNPATNTWAAGGTSSTNAPSVRSSHVAVWTGTEMIVWGGYDGVTAYLNTGGRYNPTTNTWTAGGTSTINAPTPRYLHVAVWTGAEMIVWGGWDGTHLEDTGGRYDPATNTWVAGGTSTTNAPAVRYEETAVWTGTQMIIWGGYDGVNYFNTGGRYSPATNSWIDTSTINAPVARRSHVAVWTGAEMVVWSGSDGVNLPNTGGRYNAATNSWGAGGTSTINAPTGRVGHTAAWTGADMIVWGGFDGNNLNTGGMYGAGTCPAINIAPASLPDGVLGTVYDQTLTGSGGTAPYSFAVTSGTLPAGLTLSPTGNLAGTPTAAGTSNFDVTATDSAGCSGVHSYSITITCAPITIAPGSLPNGLISTPYSQSLTASGGAAPYSYTVSTGSLPDGLTLNSSTGVISGTPTVAAIFNFQITATDSQLCTGSANYVITIDSCLFCDEFNDNVLAADWTYSATWTESSDNLNTVAGSKKASALATPAFDGCQTCSLATSVSITGTSSSRVWIYGWFVDKKNDIELLIKEANNKIILKQRTAGSIVKKQSASAAIDPSTPYAITMTNNGSTIVVNIDGANLITFTPVGTIPLGTVGFGAKNSSDSIGYIRVN